MATRTCDFCKDPAIYDAKTLLGPWAFVCEKHFQVYGIAIKGLYTKLKPTEVRVCRHCNLEKPISDFYTYTNSRGETKHRTECKDCNLAKRKIVRMHT